MDRLRFCSSYPGVRSFFYSVPRVLILTSGLIPPLRSRGDDGSSRSFRSAFPERSSRHARMALIVRPVGQVSNEQVKRTVTSRCSFLPAHPVLESLLTVAERCIPLTGRLERVRR